MPGVTRGFRGRAHATRDPRLPPGQYDTGRDFPVLTAEATPRLDPDRWTLTIDGLVGHPRTWTWRELHAAARSEYQGDIHCVTTWSKFGTSFGGVSLDLLLEGVGPLPDGDARAGRPRPPATPPTCRWQHSRGGQAWIVWTHEGQPLPREHGGPARLLVPHLYFWKSAKWVTRSRCWSTTSRASGSATATTTSATRGGNSDTRVTDPGRRSADASGPLHRPAAGDG